MLKNRYRARSIVREVKFAGVQFKELTFEGRFEGYASLFNKVDLGNDIVMPGAFQESLQKRRVLGIKMLFQHDANEPIGVWQEIKEDAQGLYVKGQLMTEIARAREVLSLMRAGALDGLSIGFRVIEGQRDPKTGIRRLRKLDLWEISVVTFPMLNDARINHVKTNRAKTNKPPSYLSQKNKNQLLARMQKAARTVRLTAIKNRHCH